MCFLAITDLTLLQAMHAGPMTLTWSELQPLRPVATGAHEAHYVAPPHKVATRLAGRLAIPNQRVALWGPVGSGKSTELRAAARHLAPAVLPVTISLDVELDLRRVPPEWEIFQALGRALVEAAAVAGIEPSAPLAKRLESAQIAGPVGAFGTTLAGPELIRELLSEISRVCPSALLVDGLEKPTSAIAHECLRFLRELGPTASLLVVLSPALVTGPEAYEVLENLEFRQIALWPAPVDAALGESAVQGREFLKEIAVRRLGAQARESLDGLLDDAAVESGGMPRTFLQLLRDAHTAASLAGRDLPNPTDLAESVRDHRWSLRRLLRDGDLDAMRDSLGSSGIEVPIERRTRLLAHGLMLEYEVPDRSEPVVYPHPLLRLDG